MPRTRAPGRTVSPLYTHDAALLCARIARGLSNPRVAPGGRHTSRHREGGAPRDLIRAKEAVAPPAAIYRFPLAIDPLSRFSALWGIGRLLRSGGKKSVRNRHSPPPSLAVTGLIRAALPRTDRLPCVRRSTFDVRRSALRLWSSLPFSRFLLFSFQSSLPFPCASSHCSSV